MSRSKTFVPIIVAALCIAAFSAVLIQVHLTAHDRQIEATDHHVEPIVDQLWAKRVAIMHEQQRRATRKP